ncbi:MAG: hypothetical protein R3249_04730 [Nitriliruptorales bacterium]|nr:hypothetical protein [Nitriliruptorales bacterium]
MKRDALVFAAALVLGGAGIGVLATVPVTSASAQDIPDLPSEIQSIVPDVLEDMLPPALIELLFGPQTPPPPPPDTEPSPSPEPSSSPSSQPPIDPSVFDLMAPPAPAAGPVPAPAPPPQVAPPAAVNNGGTTTTTIDLGVAPLAAALPGTFAIGLLAALLAAFLAAATPSALRRGWLIARTAQGEMDMAVTKRWRILTGVALLSLAAVAGLIGWLKISLETQVAVQVVYMASAGFFVVVLAVAGGSLLVAEQLRADEKRISEIEQALLMLASNVRDGVEDPARLHDDGDAN